MANEQNLRPGEYKLTLEEQKKGGIASGKARKEKATMRKTLEMLLDTKYKNGNTYREEATLGLLKGAIGGKADNYKTMIALLGELEEKHSGTPEVTINIVDNGALEKALYEEDDETD